MVAKPDRSGVAAGRVVRQGEGLVGRVALVTGGGRGIGRAIAVRLSRDGARVFVNFRTDRRAGLACVADIHKAGGEAEALQADVSDPAQVRRMFEAIRRVAGRLDILVANAGVALMESDLARITPALWRKTMDTNAASAFYCAQSAAPFLARSTQGRIVFVGSVASRLGGNVGPHYAASKAALNGLSTWLGRELAANGTTVNVVEPGYVKTNLSVALHSSAAGRAKMRREVPLGRAGTVDEVASLVAFLAGPGGAYISRERIAVAGGR